MIIKVIRVKIIIEMIIMRYNILFDWKWLTESDNYLILTKLHF